MQKFLAAIAFGAVSISAHAGRCAPLEDEKITGLSTEQLAAETCKASKINATNYDEIMANVDARQGPVPYPGAQDNFDQCEGKIDRMLRALRSKDVHEKIDDLCKHAATKL